MGAFGEGWGAWRASQLPNAQFHDPEYAPMSSTLTRTGYPWECLMPRRMRNSVIGG